MRRVGDRRARVRLDVVGALWGTLETQKRAQVVDINDTGALLLVARAPAAEHGAHSGADARRTEPVHRGAGASRPARRPVAGTYHVGVEFLSSPLASP